MRALIASVRALPVTFIVYVCEAVLAVLLTAPLGAELTTDSRALGVQRLFRAAALEHALELAPALKVQGRTIALSLLLFVLVAPLLQMAWLAALSSPLGVRRALGEGTRLYLRACAVSLTVGVLLALGLTPAALGAYLVHDWLSAGEHARLHDLLLLCCAGSALCVLWLGYVTHDLARAFCLRHGALRAARLALSRAFSLRPQLAACLLGIGGFVLGLAPLLLPARGGLGELGNVALMQGACFAALVVRSLWLGQALACTETPASSRVHGD